MYLGDSAELVEGDTFQGATNVKEGSLYALHLEAALGFVSVDSWTIDWGDGFVQTVEGSQTTAIHRYLDGPSASGSLTALVTTPSGTFAAMNQMAVEVIDVGPVLTAPTAPAGDRRHGDRL